MGSNNKFKSYNELQFCAFEKLDGDNGHHCPQDSHKFQSNIMCDIHIMDCFVVTHGNRTDE
jgi:hypothetical protein